MKKQSTQPDNPYNTKQGEKPFKARLIPTIISIAIIAVVFAAIWVVMSFVNANKINDSVGLITTLENVSTRDDTVTVGLNIENNTKYSNDSFNLDELGVYYRLILEDGTEIEPSIYSTLPLDIAKNSSVAGDLIFDISGYDSKPTKLHYSRPANSAVDKTSSSFVQPYYYDLKLN